MADNSPQETEDWTLQLNANKSLGDDAFRRGHYDEAIQHYTTALSLDPTHAALLSNRSAAYLKAGHKSKALHDAQQIDVTVLGIKAYSRLGAALQSLGRYEPALKEWQRVLEKDPQNVAAVQGKEVCERELEKLKEEEKSKNVEKECSDDDLDDFFNDVQEAAEQAVKQQFVPETLTDAIRNHKKDLGTAKEQTERLLGPNYQWRNLNPFFVLDLAHDSNEEEISRRFKALSLLLHPDKQHGVSDGERERIQQAYDEVLQAKTKLQDENKRKHVRNLIDEGNRQGKLDWEASGKQGSLEEAKSKAVQKIFATAEYNRRQAEQRMRNHEKREREQEEEALQKEKKEREFNAKWSETNRQENRVGNWRDFANKKRKT
ncbi:DnaJ homolog subfamily C member 8 [Fistulifera solaris]|uniref:DnaJ homolog subfamily C member 8 n=1 Tax=Fistulifera solaris TaxID=1519565 RepID=A0A1Z5JV28_FISSO|nr:DnaJ homolog subfamily C member 8 [Fistulifera solaris]|eukprot:GAX17769.1 DnaJ homolog subfamily C member 8 [Fistulifera solaris]